MTVTQRAYDKIGDWIEAEQERLLEENKDKPEWVVMEIVNELCECHEILYDALHKVGVFDVDEDEEEWSWDEKDEEED
jgi:uncharacterized protein (DUF608 family)